MNLKMNTQWLKNERRTYLIVNVSADGSTDASATETYLDIQLPEGVRIRHIGELPSDGHGNSIGVDFPDLSPGNSQNIVFKLKSRQDPDADIAPELHLHWIDSSSGDLVERHQTGTPMPTEPTEPNEDATEIVKTARFNNRRERTSTNKENEYMQTSETHINRRPRRNRGERSHSCRNHAAAEAGRDFGRQARNRWDRHSDDETTDITRRPRRGGHREHFRGSSEFSRHGARAGRHAWGAARFSDQHTDRRHVGKGHLRRTIMEMRERMEMLERRIARMQRGGRMVERETEREIVRTRRTGGSGRSRMSGRLGHEMRGEGRRMGRMMRRAYTDRHDG